MAETDGPAESSPSRRDLLKKGLLAGGIAAAAPVVTTFNVPAHAQTSSPGAACACGSGQTLYRVAVTVTTSGTNGTATCTGTPADPGSCVPACWSATSTSGCGRVTFTPSKDSNNLGVTIAYPGTLKGSSGRTPGGACFASSSSSSQSITFTRPNNDSGYTVYLTFCDAPS